MVQERRGPGGQVEIRVFRATDGYRVVAPDVAVFEVDRAGEHVQVRPCPGADSAALEELLSEGVLPLVHQLSGTPSVHASCVAIGGEAVGFVGRSHSGKSTMAAVFAARGARLIGDDCLRTMPDDRGLMVVPYSAGVRLRGAMAAAFGWATSKKTWDGRSLVTLKASDRPAQLTCLYLLDQGDGEPSIERLSRRDAMAAIASHLHRIDPHDRELLQREFAFLERLVDATRIARLKYARSLDAAAQAAALIEAEGLSAVTGWR